MLAVAAPLDSTSAAELTDAELVIAVRSLGAAALGGARLVAALLQPDLDGHELARRISSEPGIAARVLRVANSAYFGCTGSVATLERAIQVLGLSGIKGAAAAACMDRLVAPGGASGVFDADRFRRHSLACACAAQQLARRLAPAMSDEAFMAGLLHDLGVVVLARLRPQGLAAWLAALRNGLVPADQRSDTERRLVGCTHEHGTAVALQAWQLPNALVQATQWHHQAAPAHAEPSLGSLLACAHGLAREAGLGLEVDGDEPAADSMAQRRCGLDPALRQELVQRLPDEVGGLMAALAGG